MLLYSFWRSQAAFRIRIALGLKGIRPKLTFIDLVAGEQRSAHYRQINPAMTLPALIDGDGSPLVQSLAILEYLEEAYPSPPLLPKGLRDRAHVRALAHGVAIDAHPFVVPRVRDYLENELHIAENSRMRWLQHWLDEGTRVFEETLSRDPRTGNFCCGDVPTIADICLVPHVTSAQMLYGCDLGPYPIIQRILDRCMKIEAFASAHPTRQPDAQRAK